MGKLRSPSCDWKRQEKETACFAGRQSSSVGKGERLLFILAGISWVVSGTFCESTAKSSIIQFSIVLCFENWKHCYWWKFRFCLYCLGSILCQLVNSSRVKMEQTGYNDITYRRCWPQIRWPTSHPLGTY